VFSLKRRQSLLTPPGAALLLVLLASLAATTPTNANSVATPLAGGSGADFDGGAKDLYGTLFDGELVNTIYAQPTGSRSRMSQKFSLRRVPSGPQFLHLRGRDDDAPAQSLIRLELNGTTLFSGRNDFASPRFETRRFPIPEDVLRAGENTLVIASGETNGRAGSPPWFQLAGFAVGPEGSAVAADVRKQLVIHLPAERRPFPEPLPPGAQPGFKFRGTKGWRWTPEQYLAEIPYLKQFNMNFLMTCYLSWFDLQKYPNWNSGDANRWYEDIPEWKKQAYLKVVRECERNGILFCFGMNPNFASRRAVNDGAPESVELLFRHYAWAQSLGVKWFNISLDDITIGINASSQASVVNTIFARLRARDPEAQMIFCPTYYWGDGTGKEQQPYLEVLARELHRDVYLFWTGDDVVGKVTREATDTFRRISQRRLFLWDNYPVNDDQPTLHLGPVVDRDPDICEQIEGYMANPHCEQNEINRIPLATCADYAWNPVLYDPARSIGQAILQLAETTPQRELLRDLVETYPGFLLNGRGTGFNSVRDTFSRITATPHSRQAALAWIEHLQQIAARLDREFPDQYRPEKATLNRDIAALKALFAAKYGTNR
jgi:hypothetical protein